jgi:hypothetical protein
MERIIRVPPPGQEARVGRPPVQFSDEEKPMTSEPIRDPRADHLLTPQNCALVTDVVGGTSPEAHQAGLDRIAQAGGQPTSVVQVGCELQRDWARQETAEGFTQILFGGDSPLAGARSGPAGNGARTAADRR